MQVGGSGRNKLPKTEEIQCLEYKFRTDSQADSGWEDEPPEASPADQQPGKITHQSLVSDMQLGVCVCVG